MAKGYAPIDALEWLATVDVDHSLTVLVLGDRGLHSLWNSISAVGEWKWKWNSGKWNSV